MLSRIKKYFEDRGVTTADFPKAFIAHEFLSVAFLGLTWAACYHVQPSQSPLFAPINKTLRESNNFVVVKMRQSYQTVISKAERRIMYQEWFMKRGIDSGRMAVSLAESTFFRKLAKPVTIPAKLWLTWKFVQVVNVHGGEQQDDDRAAAATATAAGPPSAAGDMHDRRRPHKKEKGDVRIKEQRRGRRQDKGALTDPAVADGVDEPWWGRVRGMLEGSPSRGALRAGGGGWGGSRGGNRRRKSVCPPWRGAGGGPGCFALPALATTPRVLEGGVCCRRV